ncbi:MAG: RIP metalloprotease RseP [Tissierellia bacterium]|nr:RIP metalloprotease RseP [Tissierellia bacterium]
MLTFINFIIIFNLIVFFHEFGHFIMARKNGVRVHEFALGMGPAIFSRTKGDTQYSLRLLPLGGYCKMEGEDEASPNQDSFSEKTAWQRFSIIIAGPIMNFILALILFFGLNAFTGVPSLTISEVIDGPAKEAGIVAGDKVLEIDSQKIKNWQDLVNAIDLSDDKVEVLVEKASGGQQAYTLEPMVEEGVKLIGIVQGREKSFFGAFKYAVSQILSIFGSFFTFFSRLFTGQGSSDDVAGPLGLVKLVDEVTKAGFYMVVFFTAFFSMNLGVMNLLPIPALDGGRLLFIIVELVRGKPLDPDKEGMIHFAGFVFLMLVMVFVTFLDIQKWIN